MKRRGLGRWLGLAFVALLLGGCAGWSAVTSDVWTFGDWPAGRAHGTYAFERLPSQQASPALAEAVEAAVRPAMARAGFQPAAPGSEPDVLVQVATRFSRHDLAPWYGGTWWRGGLGPWRYGPWTAPPWSPMRGDLVRYESEVAVLIRDRASGKPLYEARASREDGSRGDAAVVSAMFEAALTDFPKTGLSPRQVTVTLPR